MAEHGFWARLPFAARLLVTASVALLVAGTLMAYAAAGREAAEIRSDLKEELAKELQTLPGAIAETVVVGDFATLQQVLDRYVTRPLIAEIEFEDSTGIRLGSVEHSPASDVPAWFVQAYGFSDIEGDTEVVIGGRSYGRLQIRLGAHALTARAWNHLKSHLAILLVAILLDFIGIWLVLRSGLRPLSALQEGARRMSTGDLGTQVPVEGSPELRELIAAFNHMARTLARYDEERKAQAEALRQQHERLRYILEGTHVGTWEWNVQTGAVVFNERWAEIIGYRLEELAPLSIETWSRFAHPDDLKHSGQLLQRHFNGELPYYECEVRMRHRDGHWVWVLDRGKVADWIETGKPRLMSGTHLDITDRKEAEAQLLEAKRAAESASTAKSRFLATMSHEIRTPMNGILGMAQLLLSPEISRQEQLDYARTILNSGQTLLTLLNDILDLSKIEAGRLEIEIRPFHPGRVLQEIQTLFQEPARQRPLTLSARWEGDSATRYRGDTHRLRQMLSNLVSNALKFTQEGRVDITAREVSRQDGQARLEFSVTDTGLGIPPEKQALLFKPFSQVDSSTTRQFGGTGLGLSIVSSLAQMMGGTVGVDSTPNRGSRFWFQITAGIVGDEAQDDPEAPAGIAPSTSPSQEPPTRFRGHLLVVEDNPANRKVAEAILGRLGLSVTLADNGEAGLHALQNDDSIDLVLMDVQMPVMDGLEATRRLRAWEQATGRPHKPVIALTAGAFAEDQREVAQAGMDDFLTKPIIVSQITQKMQRWLTPPAPSASPTGHMPRPPGDPARLQPLLDELLPLLAENRFDALRVYESLREAAAGTDLEETVGAAAAALEALKFDEALACLQPLRTG